MRLEVVLEFHRAWMWRQTIDVLHAALLKNRNDFSDDDPLTVFNPEFALGIPG